MKMCIALLAILSLSPATAGEEENVSVTARLSHDGVHGGSYVRAALVVSVRKGWHINSASPSDENLIATSAAFSPPAGLAVGEVRYPRGVTRTFPFSESPLDVYEGTVVIFLKITASGEVKPGTYALPVEISYQACNNDVCFAPATATVVIPVHVLAPDVTPVPRDTGLFGPGAEK
ncbi:MAG TPA: protein-disulfide reductase DsbD domain-containing protein [Bacteroidota bacterium]|nr:protein-disulfide reductase DsbD domain-containing protein [Bacteroidota bacterium]